LQDALTVTAVTVSLQLQQTQDKIEGIHNAELAILSRSTNLRSALVSVLTATPAVVIVITLGLYSSLGNVLTPSKVSAHTFR
jgi:hypothetical protein